jgi:hypothetical protein
MDGDWHNLGGALSENAEEPVALQPLLWIDEYIGRGGMDRSPPCPGRRNHHAGSQEACVVWPSFAQPLREWLKTLRRKKASVIFATQSLADIETSAIAPALVESCPTRIFLPNERAIEQQITPSIGGSD